MEEWNKEMKQAFWLKIGIAVFNIFLIALNLISGGVVNYVAAGIIFLLALFCWRVSEKQMFSATCLREYQRLSRELDEVTLARNRGELLLAQRLLEENERKGDEVRARQEPKLLPWT